MALEVGLVGEDAETGGAVGLVGACQADGLEIGPDDAGRGARLLDLGDEPDGPGAGQCGPEVAGGRRLAGLVLDFIEGDAPACLGHLCALGGDDRVEDRSVQRPVPCPGECNGRARVGGVELRPAWLSSKGLDPSQWLSSKHNRPDRGPSSGKTTTLRAGRYAFSKAYDRWVRLAGCEYRSHSRV